LSINNEVTRHVSHQSPDGGRRHPRNRRDGRGVCDVHVRRRREKAIARGDLEQHLVHALVVRGDQLYRNWVYVLFAAVGSWIGAFASMTFLHRPPGGPPVGAAPE
jgi:hypothetical protein